MQRGMHFLFLEDEVARSLARVYEYCGFALVFLCWPQLLWLSWWSEVNKHKYSHSGRCGGH